MLNHHPFYPTAQSGTLRNFKDDNGQLVWQKLTEAADADPEKVGCVEYTLNGEKRWSCAVTGYRSNLIGSGIQFVLVGGLHHDFDDVSFANLKCPYYAVADRTSAVDVKDRDTLKKFIDEFAEFYIDMRNQIGIQTTINLLNCFRVSPWRSGSVYIFMMTEANRNVILNGNDPGLENKNLDVTDEDGNNIGDLIVEAVKDLPEGEGVFVDYLWDNPVKDGDEIRDENGNPIPGKAPGNSPKTSYVVRIQGSSGDALLVGSGIYPEEGEEESGGGCALSGMGSAAAGSMGFNLFLIISLLFSAVFWKNRPGRKTAAQGKGGGAVFVCVLTLLVLLSGARNAVAHEFGDHDSDSVTARDVDVMDMESVKGFALHAKAHWENVSGANESIRFENDLTKDVMEGGDWKDDATYLMVIDKEAVIFTQPHYPGVQNGALLTELSYDSTRRRQVRTISAEVKSLIDEAQAADMGGCVKNGEGRYSCAVRFTHPVWDAELILIAGYHHGENDIIFDPVVCPYFVSEIINEPPYFRQGIGADGVEDRDTLKRFVKEFVKHFNEQVEVSKGNLSDIARIRNCWRTLPWKYGAVYTFIMTEKDKLVFFNGNTPALENGSLNVEDEAGNDVGDLVVKAVENLPEGEGAFVEYLWDDPTTPDDDVRDGEGKPFPGRSPGNSPKTSYVERIEFLGESFIIGSGYHPQDSDSDGGCAVARTGGAAESAVLNLLLAVSLLFSAAFWRTLKTSERKTGVALRS